MKKKSATFAFTETDSYVLLDWMTAYQNRNMSILAANQDGIDMLVDDNGTPYVTLDAAIAWVESDVEFCSGEIKEHREVQSVELRRIKSLLPDIDGLSFSDEYKASGRKLFAFYEACNKERAEKEKTNKKKERAELKVLRKKIYDENKLNKN